MAFCERLSEQLALVATVDPVSQGNTAVTSDAFSMSLHRRALFILSTGANPTGVLVNIQEGTVNFTAGTATILTRAATAVVGINSQYLFEVSGEAMADGMVNLRAQLTPSGAAHLISLVCLADVERYHPGSDQPPSLATVIAIQAAN